MSSGRKAKSNATPVVEGKLDLSAKLVRESRLDYLPSIRWVPILVGMHFVALSGAVYVILFS